MAVPDASQPSFGQWILGSLGSGVVAIDTRQRVVVLNAGARRILGLTPASAAAALGRPCREVLAGQPALAHLLVEALDSRRPLARAELALEAGAERARSTIGFTLSPVRDEGGALRGAVVIFRDLTPFERMDEQDRLRERLAALGQMAADLAHEIRNPLAGMQVIAGLLRRRLASRPEEREMVEQIMAELDAVAETVTAGLEFVRPLGSERVAVNPAELVAEALETARVRVPFSGPIDCHVSDALPDVHADREQLRSVLTNLIVNAFESMNAVPGEHRLTLAVTTAVTDRAARSVRLDADGRTAETREQARRELLIDVIDTGGGVPADLCEKVFYPFFTTKQHGSGVGLATSQKIVASHGGLIELDAVSGRGARFRVRLPVGADAADLVVLADWSSRAEQAAGGEG